MLRFSHWSNRRKAAAAATLAFLLWFPTGLSEVNQPVVTGHSTFWNGKSFDPCMASIAGILQTEVRWFNDMVLARRYGGKGTFIYITESGADDPRQDLSAESGKRALFSDGVAYDFVDPNGAVWHVDELYYGNPNGEPVKVTDPLGNPKTETHPYAIKDRTYVWVVELAAQPIYDQFAGSPSSPYYHDVYNFVSLVDTCKFHRTPDTNFNGNKHYEDRPGRDLDFNITHTQQPSGDWPGNNDGNGHDNGMDTHDHESFIANIWIGTRPVIVPAGASADGAEYQSEWAVSGRSAESTSRAPGTAANQTGVVG